MIESISLQDIWNLVKKTWIVIVSVTIVAALLSAIYTVAFVPKMYKSSVTMYVSNTEKSTTGNVNSGDLNASQLLANTSVQLLMKEPARVKICEELKVDVTPAQLLQYVSIKQTEETELLTIYATTPDPELSADICNAYAKIAPEYLQGIIEAGSFKAVDEAKPATSSSYPSVQRNVIVGALLGAVITFGVFFVIFLFDNSVKDADDLKKRLNLPVLGEIPSFSNNTKI